MVDAGHAPVTGPAPSRAERFVRALPGGPAAGGLVFVAAVFGTYVGIENALGHDAFRARPGDALPARGETLVTLLLASAIAYVGTARIAVRRQVARTAQALVARLPFAGDAGAHARAMRRAAAAGGPAAVAMGLLGAGVALAVPYLEVGDGPWRPYDVAQWSSAALWHRLLTPLLGWQVGRLVHAMLRGSLALSRLPDDVTRLDLLDLSPLAPLARQGLSNALWLMGFVALFALLLADAARYAPAVGAVGGLALLLGTGALLMPMQGARRCIQRAKRDELARITAALRGAPAALRTSPVAARAEHAGLADLLAWRGHVEGVREWPLDAAVLRRFGLYLLIPLGSWAGGALVERALDRLLP